MNNFRMRASSMGDICTKRPTFDEKVFRLSELKIKEKIGPTYKEKDLPLYTQQRGVITLAKEHSKLVEKKNAFLYPTLPPGAKVAVQKIWLKEEIGLRDTGVSSQAEQIRQGNLSEEDAIKVLSIAKSMPFEKYQGGSTERGWAKGDCDILDLNSIRDVKVPKNFITFRSKEEMENGYLWQGVGYCYIYKKPKFFLDYVLMPLHESILMDKLDRLNEKEYEDLLRNNRAINSLNASQRVKTYSIEGEELRSAMDFMLTRLEMAAEYYESLNYEICMKMPPREEFPNLIF